MKAITLHQPWASLIAEGHKTIETRSWAPPKALIGERIAIHAAQRPIQLSKLNARTYETTMSMAAHWPGWWKGAPAGAVVATAMLEDAMHVTWVASGVDEDAYIRVYGDSILRTDSPRLQSKIWVPLDPYGDFSMGRWLWILRDIEKVDNPIPATGHQGLWEWQQGVTLP